MPDAIVVRKIPLKNVSDASGLAELVDNGVLEADRVIAVIGKTEGNGGVNDYTRILADRAFREVLTEKGSRDRDAVLQVPIVWPSEYEEEYAYRRRQRAKAMRRSLPTQLADPGA